MGPPGYGVCGHPNGARRRSGDAAHVVLFNTTGLVNRLAYTGTLTLHFGNDDVLDALQRAYATEAEIIAALSGEGTHYTITGVRLQARGPVFNDDLAFLGVECALHG